MLQDKIMYGLDDIVIIPSSSTKIVHRGDISIRNEFNKYPIFVSPMPSIINEHNYKIFSDAGLNIIIPRTVDINIRLNLINNIFVAMGLDEFKEYFLSETNSLPNNDKKFYVCIDIANGHMEYLHNLLLEAKLKYRKNLVLMAGSVADSSLYNKFANIGVDYIRVGIGGGSICTTSVLSGCHVTLPYILSSMVKNKKDAESRYRSIHNNEAVNDDLEELEIPENHRVRRQGNNENKYLKELFTVPKIVVDGGINTFAKINKLLALGADYIMLGNMLAQTEEACADTIVKDNNKYHVYYGMSTKRAQIEYNRKELKIEEGIEKLVPIKYTLKEFIDFFSFYLREAMSLTNCECLSQFNSDNINLMLITQNGFNEFNSNK